MTILITILTPFSPKNECKSPFQGWKKILKSGLGAL
jgi:hypothetical protein